MAVSSGALEAVAERGATNEPSPGFPITGNVSCPVTAGFTWGFSGTSGFTNTQKNIVRQGIGTWASAKDKNGNSFLTATEVLPNASGNLPAGAVSVLFTPGVLGYADCANKKLLIDITGLADGEIRNLVAHEVGHYYGLSHSGTGDNVTGNPPIMETCTPLKLHNQVTHDDEGQALFRHKPTTLTGNPGFERGIVFWTVTNGTQQTSTSLPAGQGTKYLELAATNGSVQRTAVISGPTIGARNFRVRAKYKMAGGASGGPNFKLYYRTTNYPDDGSPPCGFSLNQNLNAPNFQQENLGTNVTPSNAPTSWTTYTTPALSLGFNEGYQFRLKVTNGQAVQAWVDNVELITP